MKIEINIEVQTSYLGDKSNIYTSEHVYSYTITISNNSLIGVKLLARRWNIEDESGEVKEVVGEGVVGKQPYIAPNESFQYSSMVVINTANGSMNGSYDMVDDNGEKFIAQIPKFILANKNTLH